MRCANVTLRDMYKIFKANGFQYKRQKGSHQIWSDGIDTVCIPCVNTKPVIIQKIIKKYGLEV